MNFLSSGAFWGLLIVLFGLSIILKAVFNIQFPFFKTFLGILLIVGGLNLIFGSIGHKNNSQILFSSGKLIHQSGKYDYSIIFSSGKIDLRDLDESTIEKPIKVAVVFGDGILKLDRSKQYNIKGSVAFGELIDDDEKVSGLSSKNNFQDAKAIDIEASATFGKLEIRYY